MSVNDNYSSTVFGRVCCMKDNKDYAQTTPSCINVELRLEVYQYKNNYLDLVTRIPDFVACKQQRHRPA